MAHRSTDALQSETLYYGTDPYGNVAGIAWWGAVDDGPNRVVRLWKSWGWTVARVHRDQAGPILAAFEAHKKGETK